MRIACLFSGGVDSALAAVLLKRVASPVLVTATFGVEGVNTVSNAKRGATALDLPHRTIELPRHVALEAVERMVADGYPARGLQTVHVATLEQVANGQAEDHTRTEEWWGIADGTRRDDRVPRLSDDDARSFEDRHGIMYLRPLAGLGRHAIDAFADEIFEVERSSSERARSADYELELRTLIAAEHGQSTVDEVFPDHTQSVVRAVRES